jgi:cytidylate kinase
MIAGLTGAGKTTIALRVASEFNLRYVSGSETRAKFNEVCEKAQTSDFWRDSPTARELDIARLDSPGRDLAADAEMCALAQNVGGCAFDVWALPWICSVPAVRIWLDCSLEKRAHRICQSHCEGVDVTCRSCNARVADKDRRASDFFLKAYGFELFANRAPFDAIVNTDGGEDSPAFVAEVVFCVIASRMDLLSPSSQEWYMAKLHTLPSDILVFDSMLSR